MGKNSGSPKRPWRTKIFCLALTALVYLPDIALAQLSNSKDLPTKSISLPAKSDFIETTLCSLVPTDCKSLTSVSIVNSEGINLNNQKQFFQVAYQTLRYTGIDLSISNPSWNGKLLVKKVTTASSWKKLIDLATKGKLSSSSATGLFRGLVSSTSNPIYLLTSDGEFHKLKRGDTFTKIFKEINLREPVAKQLISLKDYNGITSFNALLKDLLPAPEASNQLAVKFTKTKKAGKYSYSILTSWNVTKEERVLKDEQLFIKTAKYKYLFVLTQPKEIEPEYLLPYLAISRIDNLNNIAIEVDTLIQQSLIIPKIVIFSEYAINSPNFSSSRPRLSATCDISSCSVSSAYNGSSLISLINELLSIAKRKKIEIIAPSIPISKEIITQDGTRLEIIINGALLITSEGTISDIQYKTTGSDWCTVANGPNRDRECSYLPETEIAEAAYSIASATIKQREIQLEGGVTASYILGVCADFEERFFSLIAGKEADLFIWPTVMGPDIQAGYYHNLLQTADESLRCQIKNEIFDNWGFNILLENGVIKTNGVVLSIDTRPSSGSGSIHLDGYQTLSAQLTDKALSGEIRINRLNKLDPCSQS